MVRTETTLGTALDKVRLTSTSTMAGFSSNPRVPFSLSSDRPKLAFLEGRPLIVHIIVNVEYWPFSEPTPRTIVVPPHGRANIPDIPNFSWAEYGNRCGMPRLLKLFGDRGIPVSVSMNVSVLDVYPTLAEACRSAGWEFVGHGVHQRSISAETDERAMIRESLDRMEAFCGQRPRGWMSPGWSESFDTPDFLRAEGIDYVFEWVIDDLPTWMRTEYGPLLSLPYALDLNDSVIMAIEKHSTREFGWRVQETVKAFVREIGETGQPRILTLPVHPHLVAVPHRIDGLIDIIDGLQARSDTVFVTGRALADWFVDQSPPPGFD